MFCHVIYSARCEGSLTGQKRGFSQTEFMRVLIFIFCLLGACARGPLKSTSESMRRAEVQPSLADDLNWYSFVAALEANLKQLRMGDGPLDFGPRRVAREDYIRASEILLAKAKEDATGEAFRAELKKSFEPYEVYGQDNWGQVLITSYFEPIIEGSLKKTARFSQALYGVPKDMVLIDLKTFDVVPQALEQRSRGGLLRGRLIASRDIARVTAYPDRQSFEAEEKKPAEILAYVDPIDGFFLEIQGSGAIKLKEGRELRVGYAGQNGHPYVPIGKHLIGPIPKEKITLHSIEEHLRQVGPLEARRIMNLNPSYVFFQKLEGSGLTFFGTEVQAGRTIATDQTLFPKGALAFLEFEKPRFNSLHDTEPAEWIKASRFVLDQDTGGAIRGPHRVDLFWGKGPEAKQAAGVMKGSGRLVYFVPKPPS